MNYDVLGARVMPRARKILRMLTEEWNRSGYEPPLAEKLAEKIYEDEEMEVYVLLKHPSMEEATAIARIGCLKVWYRCTELRKMLFYEDGSGMRFGLSTAFRCKYCGFFVPAWSVRFDMGYRIFKCPLCERLNIIPIWDGDANNDHHSVLT